jgi:hypothetical protein
MVATQKKIITIITIIAVAVFLLIVVCGLITDPDIGKKIGDNNAVNNTDRYESQGEIFYINDVLPKLSENGCLKCHAKGYMNPTVSYESMLRRLAIGDSAENNVVIYKLANVRSFSPQIPNHPGGQRCATIDAEPCKTIRQWWQIEFGQQRADK